MDGSRIWAFEESLWTASPEHYRDSIDDECLMVLPALPFVFTGAQSVEAVSQTPRWDRVELSERQVARPQEGLIVIAYKAEAVAILLGEDDSGEVWKARCQSMEDRFRTGPGRLKGEVDEVVRGGDLREFRCVPFDTPMIKSPYFWILSGSMRGLHLHQMGKGVIQD